VAAWYGLAALSSDPVERRNMLEHVLALRPDHQKAQELLTQLDDEESQNTFQVAPLVRTPSVRNVPAASPPARHVTPTPQPQSIVVQVKPNRIGNMLKWIMALVLVVAVIAGIIYFGGQPSGQSSYVGLWKNIDSAFSDSLELKADGTFSYAGLAGRNSGTYSVNSENYVTFSSSPPISFTIQSVSANQMAVQTNVGSLFRFQRIR
jgi:hypothetical protein